MNYTFTFYEKGKRAKKGTIKVRIAVGINKKRVAIHFGKINPKKISETGYIVFAVPQEEPNKLFFTPSDKKYGYWLATDSGGNCKTQVAVESVSEMLRNFEGSYELEREDDYIFIDKRHALKG